MEIDKGTKEEIYRTELAKIRIEKRILKKRIELIDEEIKKRKSTKDGDF